MNGFNFLEPELKRTWQVSGRLVCLLWVLVAGLVMHNVLLGQVQSAQQRQLVRVKQQMRTKAKRVVQNHHPHWRRFLLLLSQTLPQKAYLTRLRLKSYEVRIWGVADTKEVVRQFLNRLLIHPQVNNVRLSELEHIGHTVRFTMQLKVKHEK